MYNVVSYFDLNQQTHLCLSMCVHMCPSLTDSNDVCRSVCHMLRQPTPPGCVGGDTLHSVWHAAQCPGLSRGWVGDRTMMCFMGNNANTPQTLTPPCPDPLNPEAFGLVEYRALSHSFCVRPFVFSLTVYCPLLPSRSRMWMPASVSWTPEE